MKIIITHKIKALLCAIVVIAAAQTARADVSLDQLLFIEQDEGYAVRAQPDQVLEGVLTIPAEYNGKPVIEIAADGFKEQVKLTEVNIPGAVKLINGFAFLSCVSMTKATLTEGLIKIGTGAFCYCESLTEVNIPSTVESIGSESFIRCNLKDLVIPASIKNIEPNAFDGCRVQKLTFSEGITHIGAETFAGLGDLQELQLPATLETIGEYAFYKSGLTEVSLPASLKSLGEHAFGCEAPMDAVLTRVTVEGNFMPEGFVTAFQARNASIYGYKIKDGSITLEIPNIDWKTFKYEADLEPFKIHNNYDALEFTFKSEYMNGYDYKFYEVTPKQKNISELTNGFLFIPASYYSDDQHACLPVCIADNAFTGCKGLEYVWLSSKLVDINQYIPAIGNGTFRDCDLMSLEQLPGESINDFAFYECTSLKNVNFPDGLKKIGMEAFAGCTSLAESNHNEGLILPNSLKEIGHGAFAECGFYYAILPEGLESLLSTFEGCQNLVAVEIPFTVIDIARAFAGCKNLEQIAIPEGLRRIGEYCFFGCESLREVEIPSKVEYIGPNAFEGCSSLGTINIPEGINTIECATFQNCSALNEIKLPNSLEYIRDSAFNSCKKLKKIDIPEGVKEIGTWCFSDTELEEIHIPQSIEMIGIGAFCCTTLKDVYYNSPASPLEIADDIYVFYEQTYETATLYVPSTAIDAIKATKPWCYFKDIRIGEFNGIENIAVENNAPVEIYNISGVKIGNSAEGLTPGIYIRKQGAECTKISVH